VDVPRHLKVNYELVEISTGRLCEGQLQKRTTKSYSLWRVDQVRFTGLRLGEEYLLRVLTEVGVVFDQRRLRALDTRRPDARVAILSCMLELNPNRHEMWRAVEKSKPDVLFFHGDNVYGDIFNFINGPRILWFRYVTTRRLVPFYHWESLVPVFAIWDDHDFGLNNVDGNYVHKENSLAVFNSFYAQQPIDDFYMRGPGVSGAVDMFGHRIIFLDGRYFRALPSEKHGTGLLGDEQFQWVSDLVNSTDQPLWLTHGSQFFAGEPGGHSYEIHGRAEFDSFKKMLAQANRPVVLTSGDVHYTEIMKLRRQEFGLDCYELTSSSLHSVPDKFMPRNRRRTDATLKENFLFLDFNGSDAAYDVTCIGRNEKIRFRRRLEF
jgi:phosphodiesterase/alkaline phosphatase D-like protein